MFLPVMLPVLKARTPDNLPLSLALAAYSAGGFVGVGVVCFQAISLVTSDSALWRCYVAS
jgi:hypothetical protein